MFNAQNILANDDMAPDLAAILAVTRSEDQTPNPHDPEGQLAVDVLETPEEIIIVAAMAGTKSEDLELHLNSDVFTIRGYRRPPVVGDHSYFYRECFWGRFSRTIVLPTDVQSEHTRAEYKNGVLTVWMPKARRQGGIPIMVVEE